jgi:hypothetical protein
MIPNIIHFVFVAGGRPFSFIHFLAVYTAWRVNRPDRIYFHHTGEPEGHWWQKAKPFLTLNRVEPVREVEGNPVTYPAHQADIIRLAMLARFGGVYLDLDVVSLNSLAPLRERDFVMGIEPGTGLCNAVILSRADAPFLSHWRQQYRHFDAKRWNHHSVILPWILAQEHPEWISVADQYAFFYPTHNDPVHSYLWGGRPRLAAIATRLLKNIVRLGQMAGTGNCDAVKLALYRTFHALHGPRWHYRKADQSYLIHLWEGLWGEPYLSQVTPAYLRTSDSHFARLLRARLSEEELLAMETDGPMPAARQPATPHQHAPCDSRSHRPAQSANHAGAQWPACGECG